MIEFSFVGNTYLMIITDDVLLEYHRAHKIIIQIPTAWGVFGVATCVRSDRVAVRVLS